MTNREYLEQLTIRQAVKYYYEKVVCKECDLQGTNACKNCIGQERLRNWLEEEVK